MNTQTTFSKRFRPPPPPSQGGGGGVPPPPGLSARQATLRSTFGRDFVDPAGRGAVDQFLANNAAFADAFGGIRSTNEDLYYLLGGRAMRQQEEVQWARDARANPLGLQPPPRTKRAQGVQAYGNRAFQRQTGPNSRVQPPFGRDARDRGYGGIFR